MSHAVKNKTNLYLVLDLMPGASHNDILHAYNRAKSTYASGSLASYTLLEDDSKQSILSEIEEAFGTLGNPAKRRAYDLEMGFNTWADEGGAEVSGGSYDSQRMMRSSSQVKKSDTDGFGASTTSQSAPLATKTEAPAAKFSEKINPKTRNESGADFDSSGRVIPMKSNDIPAMSTGDNSFFEPNPEFEKKIQECTEVSGPFLKAVRIYRGLAPDALASRCKLSSSHVLALENEEHASNQAVVYLRGHVYLVCQALGLPNPNVLAKGYADRMFGDGKLYKRDF